MINIQDIIPYMKKGWVAMDANEFWVWYSHRPVISKNNGRFMVSHTKTDICPLGCFPITPADDWTKSLIKVGAQ